MLKNFFVILFFLICYELSSQQNMNYYLDEVVLTDSRFPIKRTQSGKSIIKIGPKEINSFLGRDLSELLSLYSGINIIGSNYYSTFDISYINDDIGYHRIKNTNQYSYSLHFYHPRNHITTYFD